MLLALLFALAACVDEEDDRRFANDPLPPEDRPTLPPSPPAIATVPPATPGPTQASPEALLVADDAPSRIYFLTGEELWTISTNGDEAFPVYAPTDAGEVIAAFAPSRQGDEVAILLVATEQATPSKQLIIVDAGGTVVHQINLLETAKEASDGVDRDASSLLGDQPSIDWSPDGNRLLVAFEEGGLIAVPLHDNSEPKLLIDADQMSMLAKAAWSPDGDAVAFLSPGLPGGDSRLFVAPAGAPPLDPVAVAPPQGTEGRSVTGMAWMPDGSGILFTEDVTTTDATMGGDLFRASPSGADRTLVASAGRAAPVADVIEFAPSPDGRAVAYTVFLPGSGGATFHSLWVQPINGAESLRVPVPSGQTVTDLWWTATGLVWRSLVDTQPGTTTYDGDAFSLYRIDTAGDPIMIYEHDPIPPATPEASPAASPVATPLASPVASPALDLD